MELPKEAFAALPLYTLQSLLWAVAFLLICADALRLKTRGKVCAAAVSAAAALIPAAAFFVLPGTEEREFVSNLCCFAAPFAALRGTPPGKTVRLFLLLFCTADMLWTFTAPLIGRNAVSEYAFRAALAAALTAAALAAGKRGGPRIAAGVFAQIPPAVVGVMLLFELACYYRDYGVSEAWYNAMYAVSACLMLFSVLWFAYRALRLTAARDELLGRMSELLAGGTELAGTDESLRRFRHDFKNHTIVLEALLTEGDIEGARRYVSALTGAAAAGMPAFVTGNAAVNALLSAKAAATAPDGIRIVFRGRIPAEGIDPTRLCVIAGNLLDNAAEACRLLPEGTDRLIGVSAAAEGQSLLFSVRNPTAGQIKRAADGSPATTKGNRRLHGFGLRNVRDAAKSLGGSLTLETENGTFTANVLIPIGG